MDPDSTRAQHQGFGPVSREAGFSHLPETGQNIWVQRERRAVPLPHASFLSRHRRLCRSPSDSTAPGQHGENQDLLNPEPEPVGRYRTDLVLQDDGVTLADVQREDGVSRPHVQRGAVVAEQQRGGVADAEVDQRPVRGVWTKQNP